MKIPPKIRITSKISYKIAFIDYFPEDLDCLGTCCVENRLILLKKHQSKRSQEEVLIHEILHAIEFTHKIEIPHKAVDALGPAILRVLKLNDWLYKEE